MTIFIQPEILLAEFVRAEVGQPFEWGWSNCVALALRAIDAMLGTTLHPKHQHHMATARRAAAWTRKHGIAGIIEAVKPDGLVEIKPNFAQPGDILLGRTTDGQISAHVSLGARALSSTAENGVFVLIASMISPPPTTAIGWRIS